MSAQSIIKITAETNQYERNMRQATQTFNKFMDGIGLNMSKFTALGAAIGVVSTALKVAKDAFFANDSQVDEWGRTVAAGKSIYEGFLQALNNGNFSSFFANMDNIVQKARDAYDALDRLQTMMTIINPERVKLQSAQTEIKSKMRRGEISQEEGQSQLRTLEPLLADSYKKEAGMNWDAFQKEVKRKLATAGETLTNDQFGMLMRSFHDSKFAEQMMGQARGSRNTKVFYMGGTQNGQAMYRAETTDTRNMQQRLMDLFTDDWRKQWSPLLTASFGAINASNQVMLGDARYLKGGGGGSGRGTGSGRGIGRGRGTADVPPPTGSIAEQEAKVQALTKAWRNATDEEGRKGYAGQLEEAKRLLDEMTGKESPAAGSMAALNKELSEIQEKQSMVTTSDEWKQYEEKIKAVEKSMKELRGEMEEMETGFAGVTDDSIAAWLSGQRTSLGGMEKGGTDYRNTMANIIDAQTLENVLNYAIANDINISPDTIESLWEQIISGDNIPDSTWESLAETINDAVEGLGIKPIKIDVKTGDILASAKQTEESWQDAAKAVQSVGSALQNIEDPSAKIAGLIGQAIANIALGFAQATASDSKLGVFGWIAAIAGGMATMLSTIDAIHSATGYAQGGIVGGNSFSGDNQYIRANAGEVVLTRAQAGNLASQLGGTPPVIHIEGVIAGEDIRLVQRNLNKRQGKGEYVTSRNYKST